MTDAISRLVRNWLLAGLLVAVAVNRSPTSLSFTCPATAPGAGALRGAMAAEPATRERVRDRTGPEALAQGIHGGPEAEPRQAGGAST